MNITIKNWAKFNPRSDRANFTWFRMENRLFESLFSLADDQKVLFLYILCEASKNNSGGELALDLDLASAMLKSNSKKIISGLEFLKSKNMIELHMVVKSRHDDGVMTALLHATDGRTNETRRDETNGVTPEFAEPAEAVPAEASPSHPKSFESLTGLFNVRKIAPSLSASWLHAFPEPEWVIQEVNKAVAWENANPRSRKKDFGRFMTNWLNRGWDSRRVPTNKNSAEQRSQANQDVLRRFAEKHGVKNES